MKVDNSQENYNLCICGTCPTHNECMTQKKEKLYCARGKTNCQLEQNGCLCGECPVASKYQLKKLYYCKSGAEK